MKEEKLENLIKGIIILKIGITKSKQSDFLGFKFELQSFSDFKLSSFPNFKLTSLSNFQLPSFLNSHLKLRTPTLEESKLIGLNFKHPDFKRGPIA